jgi:lipopolysaccharide transport system permease protein
MTEQLASVAGSRVAMTARPHVVIESAGRSLFPPVRELWAYRDLFIFLAWRDIAVKYKQTALGVMWAVLQPLMTAAVFAFVFGRVARVSSEGVPYMLFALAGLVVWQLFASVLTRASGSLVGNAGLLSKVYFPRLIIPLASALPALLDFVVTFSVLLVMAVGFGVLPSWRLILVPVLLLLAFMTALGAGLWLAALHVRFRDVAHLVPFLIQFWMFASPVLYPTSLVPPGWRTVFMLNPVAPIVDGFRWAVLGVGTVRGDALALSAGISVALLTTALMFFTRTEETFADVV